MLNVRLHQSGPIPLDAEFHCGPGELLALVGPSGSGKTSLLRATAGLLRVAHGRIVLDGETLFDTEAAIDIPAERRPIGMVFQQYALFPHLDALENVRLALPRSVDRGAALRLLQDMQLDGLARRRPHELSGGQKQRVALARALARQPKLLLLDEAFSAVDQPTRQALYDELFKLRERVGVPIVMVTHDLHEARLLADRLCILERGTTLQEGPPERVMSRPRNARVAALVGLRDIHSGIFHKGDGALPSGRLLWGESGDGVELTTIDKGRIDNGANVRWVVAGEHVQIRTARPEGRNVVACELTQIRRLGEITSVECRLLSPPRAVVHLELTTRQAAQSALQRGASLFLQIDPEGIHIMPVRAKSAAR